MKTMIVVDDEYLVRVGIRETIDWNAHDILIVGEAANGRAGLELIERLQPDLVISDVKMPLLDGVELVKAVQAKGIDLAVVILSGFKDFDFAKGALENGATEYLLKPIDNDELVAAVRRAIAKLDLRRYRAKRAAVAESELPAIRKALFEALVRESADAALSTRLADAGIVVPVPGRLIYGAIDAAETYLDPAAHAAALIALASMTAGSAAASTLSLAEREFFILTPETLDDGTWEARLRDVLIRFEHGYSDIVSLSVSRPYGSIAEIACVYADARTAAKNKFFPAVSTISTPSAAKTPWKPLVIRTLELIARDYDKNLTVRSVTETLLVSESYLLHTFKRETGVTFNECLTNYRILTSKRLLLQNTYKVYEIAAKVGYSDEKYFSTVFKKIVGMTPSDYADKGGTRDR
ncbi:MAG TPA: hypothetical protein DCR44_01620 [Acholeplasmatales bacterium]|nr:MAG: hypothetical protein A2Y16_04070 [Tenericutes bacterium GWF2_57_13]HAQ56092.1 hypothetical protein [Acholeplasmatales bacterium]